MSFYFSLFKKNSAITHSLFILLLFVITILLYGSVFENFLTTNILGGYDTAAHFSINNYYRNNIFPHIYGWIPNFYAGMPFPLFYPPLFYFLTSSISYIFSVELFTIFKHTIIWLSAILPLVLYRANYILTRSKISSLLNGLIAILFLGFPYRFGGEFGVSITGTINSGLITQLLGSILFFIWLPSFIKSKKKIRQDTPSIILFSLLLLSNVHVIQISLISIAILYIYGLYRKKKKFKETTLYYIKYISISLGLVSFWYIPLIKYYSFSTTKIVSNVFLQDYPLWFLIVLSCSLFIGYIFSYKKDVKEIQKIIIIIVSLLLILFLIPLFLSGLPIQPYRSLPIIFLLISLVISYSIVSFVKGIKSKKYIKYSVYLLILIPFVIAFKQPPIDIGSYPKNKAEDFKNAVEYLKDVDDSRSMVEVFTSQDTETLRLIPEHSILAALLGSKNHQTIWTVFRESSINSFFIQALRNSFSFGSENFGIICFLCENKSIKELRDNNIETKIKRASLFNVQYFLIHTGPQYIYFKKYPEYFEEVFTTPYWNIFKLKTETEYARILDYQPHLVFAALETKDRKENGPHSFDWIRINEEWFRGGNFDNLWVKNNKTIDGQMDLNYFSTITIFDYKYDSLENAYTKLEEYSDGKNALLLFPKNDPLYTKLLKLKRKNIISLDLSYSPKDDIASIIEIIDRYKKPIKTNARIDDVKIQKNIITLDIANQDSTIIPVQISSSYFPSWKSDGDETLYLSSPAFILIFTNQESINIHFKTEQGYLISVLSFILILYLFISTKMKLNIKYVSIEE